MDGSNGGEGRARRDGADGQGPGAGGKADGRGQPGQGGAATPDLAALARDWIELWQSELAAVATDPETAETWVRLATLWAGAAAAGIAAMPRGLADDRHTAAPWGAFAGNPFWGSSWNPAWNPSSPGAWGAPWPAAWPQPGAHAGPYPGAPPGPQPGPWSPPPPRPAAPAAAPDAGGAPPQRGAERLLERVLDQLDAIERRLAALEQRGGGERAARIADVLGAPGLEPAALPGAVFAELLRQDAALVSGIAAYRRHPYARDVADPLALWAEGGSRLLDYGATAPREADGPALLVVPSLVNRAYVLDLTEELSFLRFLAARGMRPLLLDWGWPGETERRFGLTDLIAGRLERALAAAAAISGGPVVVVGYCMGGLLALAACLRRPELVRGFAALATPWDFHAGDPDRARVAAMLLPLLEPLMAFHDAVPVDGLQFLFTALDPFGVVAKYRAFSRLAPDSARARLFVALEDWLADGVPLAAPVARECIGGWYGRNEPGRLAWSVAGLIVDPRALAVPAFVAAPGRDRIVPPEGARALGALIPGAVLHEPASGHIGMVAGSGAEAALWRPFATWVAGL